MRTWIMLVVLAGLRGAFAQSFTLTSSPVVGLVPSAAAGWALQQSRDIAQTNWSPGGYDAYGIEDDGTNKSLTMPVMGNIFFRLLHP